MTTILVLIGIIWIVCGVLAYGFSFASLQNPWPDRAKKDYVIDCLISIGLGVCGPFGLICCLILRQQNRCGFKWK